MGSLAGWPRRRWLVTAISAPLLVLTQLNSTPAGPPLSPAWWVATTMTAALTGVVLASYVPVPGSGRLPHVGCTPCAALAGFLAVFAVLGSLGSVSTGSALLALALDKRGCLPAAERRRQLRNPDRRDAAKPG